MKKCSKVHGLYQNQCSPNHPTNDDWILPLWFHTTLFHLWQHNSFISKCLKLLKGLCICVCLLSMRLWNINIGKNCFTFKATDSKQMNHGKAYGIREKKTQLSVNLSWTCQPNSKTTMILNKTGDFPTYPGIMSQLERMIPCQNIFGHVWKMSSISDEGNTKTTSPPLPNIFQTHKSVKKLKVPL